MRDQRGFSLIEILVVVAVFTIVTGAVFLLLDTAQQRYRAESERLDAFQGARIALDQIVRDVHSAGYPSIRSVNAVQLANPAVATRVAFPFAWDPGYSAVPCVVGAGCRVPSPTELIVETDVDPENNNGVEWVRYSLQNNTLFRAVVSKQMGVNPLIATQAGMIPYVENVMNSATAAEMAQIQASYPTMFPGNAQVPVFRYRVQPGRPSNPQFIRDVEITLIVRSQGLDPKTQQPYVVTLTGLARRVNAN